MQIVYAEWEIQVKYNKIGTKSNIIANTTSFGHENIQITFQQSRGDPDYNRISL